MNCWPPRLKFRAANLWGLWHRLGPGRTPTGSGSISHFPVFAMVLSSESLTVSSRHSTFQPWVSQGPICLHHSNPLLARSLASPFVSFFLTQWGTWELLEAMHFTGSQKRTGHLYLVCSSYLARLGTNFTWIKWPRFGTGDSSKCPNSGARTDSILNILFIYLGISKPLSSGPSLPNTQPLGGRKGLWWPNLSPHPNLLLFLL